MILSKVQKMFRIFEEERSKYSHFSVSVSEICKLVPPKNSLSQIKNGGTAPVWSFAVQALIILLNIDLCLRPERRQGRAHPLRVLWLTASGCWSACIAFHAGPISHQSVVPAFSTRISFVALHFSFCPCVHRCRMRYAVTNRFSFRNRRCLHIKRSITNVLTTL